MQLIILAVSLLQLGLRRVVPGIGSDRSPELRRVSQFAEGRRNLSSDDGLMADPGATPSDSDATGSGPDAHGGPPQTP